MLGSNVFLNAVIEVVPRLLGQLNRNPSSLSYGSFDRAYWHYRTNDMSCARYQEALLTLAMLYKTQFEGNIYYRDGKILAWINAAFKFSCSIQNKDGSFDEWYPHEGSFVATSFVTAALAKALLVLGRNDVKNYDSICRVLVSAADWIAKHEEGTVFNQVSGGAVALLNVFVLTQDVRHKYAAREKMRFLLSHQSKEGWWSEYGGPDIGYLSLTIDYLSRYYESTRDLAALEALKRANAFLIYFLYPNFTTGGEHMSRNTEYLIPSGFARLSSLDNNARIITAFNAVALEKGSGINPRNLDDRYLCYILYNWLEAGIAFQNENYMDDVAAYFNGRNFDIFFELSGIRVVQNKKYYFITNLRKGGAFRIYAKEEFYFDSGVEVLDGGRTYFSNVIDDKNEISTGTDVCRVRGKLKPLKEPLMSTWIMIVFKVFQVSLGRIGTLQKIIKRLLRNKMIIYSVNTPIVFERKFTILEGGIHAEDVLDKEIDKNYLHVGVKSSYAFIPSSKYFATQELLKNCVKLRNEEYLMEGGKSVIRRAFLV